MTNTKMHFLPTFKILPMLPCCHLDNDNEQDTDLLLAPELKTEEPQYFAVVLYNDDYTPMGFVVEVLMDCFQMPMVKALEVMLAVHREGRGVAGVYSRDIAETKSWAVNTAARKAGYPLLALVEPC
ncbi:ATP-dependent Clp protease adaptor protein ClpS [Moraxella macacae 0408225]|uniref:ATP-dependent Clp protease adapter protein ClpS n=1 Tax=Moraxella macacae 0408225 TaxID=1230338 RepID=L2F743_9GAMM|nr:ATP-dependent Clp protease adaptor ClpS [Moraxella macacae]ELA08566.1 ATP-dependent Clp protease adaptor protein ClpS [Moraxella macacae 0408225]